MKQTVTAYCFADGRVVVHHDPECGGDIAGYYLPEDHENAVEVQMVVEVPEQVA